MTERQARYRAAYLFICPILALLVIFRLYPVASAFWESLYQVQFQGRVMERIYVGLRNFQDLWGEPIFWKSLWVTLKFNLIVNPLQIGLALILALLLNLHKNVRTIYMLPLGVSLPIASIIWRIILDPNQGIANGLLKLVGITPQPFFTSADQALWSVIIIATWKGLAFWMIFLVAGLQNIPSTCYEAARIDGANLWQEIVHISIPLLRRIILFVLVVDTSINFVLFAPMYIITRGGPTFSTNVLMYEAYRSGFTYQDWGRAMAIAIILLVIVLVIVGIQFKAFQTREY